MSYPRALHSPIMAMARPRRPLAEIAAVRKAAMDTRVEIGNLSDRAVSHGIARKVVGLLVAENPHESPFPPPDHDENPIWSLAFGEGFGAVDELCIAMRDKLSAIFGVAIVPEFQQTLIRKRETEALTKKLAERYAKHLRRS